MKHLKTLGIAAVAAMALMAALGAGSASATTLEETAVTKNSSVTFTLSLKAGTSSITKDTAGFSQNTCTTSHVHGNTTPPFTGTSATGDITTLTYSGCTRPVTVHKPGKLEITWTSGTNGTVASEETEITLGSPFGTLTCKTGVTTNIGTLTGVAAGNATIDINAVLNCGIIPSAKWEGTYTVTSPHGLGVSP